MTIKKVKDNLNKERRREAYNRIHGKLKNAGKQKGHISWQKELRDLFETDDTEKFYNDNYDDFEEINAR